MTDEREPRTNWRRWWARTKADPELLAAFYARRLERQRAKGVLPRQPKRADKRLRPLSARNAEYCSAYRARKHGAARVEKIDRQYVIARDKSICHICGKRVPAGEIELDHLVPLSRGGDHTHDNVAVSHRVCNRRRGAGHIDAQLRLIG